LKKVFIYGGLDPSPTTISRAAGFRFSINGWLVWDCLEKSLGVAKIPEFQKRIVENLKTTFKTTYDKEISLHEVLDSEIIKKYSRLATGEKYLVNPSKVVQSKL